MVGGLFIFVLLLCVGPFLGAAVAALPFRGPDIVIRLGSRRVGLYIDKHLRTEQSDAFVHTALQYLKLGDKEGLRRVTAESREASARARQGAG
jgi:hypothetical protein